MGRAVPTSSCGQVTGCNIPFFPWFGPEFKRCMPGGMLLCPSMFLCTQHSFRMYIAGACTSAAVYLSHPFIIS
jgi:hypothetical protein